MLTLCCCQGWSAKGAAATGDLTRVLLPRVLTGAAAKGAAAKGAAANGAASLLFLLLFLLLGDVATGGNGWVQNGKPPPLPLRFRRWDLHITVESIFM